MGQFNLGDRSGILIKFISARETPILSRIYFFLLSHHRLRQGAEQGVPQVRLLAQRCSRKIWKSSRKRNVAFPLAGKNTFN